MPAPLLRLPRPLVCWPPADTRHEIGRTTAFGRYSSIHRSVVGHLQDRRHMSSVPSWFGRVCWLCWLCASARHCRGSMSCSQANSWRLAVERCIPWRGVYTRHPNSLAALRYYGGLFESTRTGRLCSYPILMDNRPRSELRSLDLEDHPKVVCW